MSNKIAICMVVYNEEKNIGRLIERILEDDLRLGKVYIYTDGSTDNTARIIGKFYIKYPSLIVHLEGKKNLGKNHGINVLLNKVGDDYDILFFLDGDVMPEKGSLIALYNYLASNTNIKAASPFFLPYLSDLRGLEKTMAILYKKSRVHIANCNKCRGISGRFYGIRRKALLKICESSYFDDFYLNLQIPYESIGLCREAVVYYRRPSIYRDYIDYNIRLGKAMASIKNNFPDLWKEQLKRVTLNDYALYDLTKYKFNDFFFGLDFGEKIVFIFTRIITTLCMYYGFYTYRSLEKTWKVLPTTKIAYLDNGTKN